MSDSISMQLLSSKIGHEALVNQFLEQLMKHQGMYVRVPIPMQRVNPPEDFEGYKQAIWKSTSDILDMMGIPYKTNLNSLAIMVIETDHDWTKDVR